MPRAFADETFRVLSSRKITSCFHDTAKYTAVVKLSAHLGFSHEKRVYKKQISPHLGLALHALQHQLIQLGHRFTQDRSLSCQRPTLLTSSLRKLKVKLPIKLVSDPQAVQALPRVLLIRVCKDVLWEVYAVCTAGTTI